MSRRDYLYCSCGSVFHPDYAEDFNAHTTGGVHDPLTNYEAGWFIDRICAQCNQKPGEFAYGPAKGVAGRWSYWLCRDCITETLAKVGA